MSPGNNKSLARRKRSKKRNDNGDEIQEPTAKKSKPNQQQQKQQQTRPNRRELPTNPVLLPRDGRVVLLDIEGTTTSISFVKDTLFPYIVENVSTYLHDMTNINDEETLEKLLQLKRGFEEDIKAHGMEDAYTDEEKDGHDKKKEEPKADRESLIDSITRMVRFLVTKDVKGKHLKDFQGDMWKCGYEQGKLHGHVYDDVLPTFQWMAQKGAYVYIYSSGSVQAQKLLFQYSTSGKLIKYLSGHFDINNAGPKREANSYRKILDALKQQFHHTIDANQVVFVSDVEQELEAADQAGFKTVLSIRPGNAPCSEHGLKRFCQVHSLLQLCGGEDNQG